MSTPKMRLLPLLSTALLLFAPLPSHAQTILACVGGGNGQVRIVSASEQCKPNETAISWNQTGPQGPAGPTGAQGLTGPQGPAGVSAGSCSDSDTKTALLFPFVTNTSGFDTAVSVANTTTDTLGTTPKSGTCTLNFFGSGAPTPFTTPTVASGTVYSNIVSTIAPGFQGYMIAVCNFPLAHGWQFLSDIGARNLASSYLAVNICSPRVPPQ